MGSARVRTRRVLKQWSQAKDEVLYFVCHHSLTWCSSVQSHQTQKPHQTKSELPVVFTMIKPFSNFVR